MNQCVHTAVYRPERSVAAAGFSMYVQKFCPRPAILCRAMRRLLSKWGNPFSYSQRSQERKEGKEKAKEKTAWPRGPHSSISLTPSCPTFAPPLPSLALRRRTGCWRGCCCTLPATRWRRRLPPPFGGLPGLPLFSGHRFHCAVYGPR